MVEDLSGKTLADRYILKELIGVGGMNSSVWRAWQRSTERVVAIKVLPPADPAAAGRFARGARIASNISHPHATIVHDYGQTPEGQLFLVMEMLEGYSLHRVLKQSGALPLPRAIHITEQVLKALESAHKQRVVHRDLKPGNLFLVHRNEDEDYVKVLDFGIAKYIVENPEDGSEEPAPTVDYANEVTQERQVCGTPHYMAPEQVALGKVDARTDLYALGVVFYRMLTGRLPFEGKSHHDLFRMHLTEKPPAFADVRADVELPDALEALVMKSLSKDPDSRFQSAREMRAALRVVRRTLGVFSGDEPDSSSSWRGTPAPAAPPWQATGETVDALPAPRESRRGLLWGLLAALCVLGVLVIWMKLPRGAEELAGPTSKPLAGEGAALGALLQPDAGTVVHRVGAQIPDAPAPEVAYVTVKLQSTPSGAQVSHDGTPLGETPINVKLPVGVHNIKLTLDGHVTEVVPLTLTRDQEVESKRITLEPTSPATGATTKDTPKTAAAEPPVPKANRGSVRSRKRPRRRTSLPKETVSPALAAPTADPPKADPPEVTPSKPTTAVGAVEPSTQGKSAPSGAQAVNVQLLDEPSGRTFGVNNRPSASSQSKPSGKKPPKNPDIDLLDIDDVPTGTRRAPSAGSTPPANIELIQE